MTENVDDNVYEFDWNFCDCDCEFNSTIYLNSLL